MQIECRFFGPFRNDVGVESVDYETDADTYGELLREIEAEFPVLQDRLVEDGELAGEVAVTRNGTNIRHHDGLDTPVHPDDVVRMVPSVYGG